MPTIAAIATGSSDFSILVAALQHVDANTPGPGLVAALSDKAANLTVLAPDNAAFGRLAGDLGFTGNVEDATAVAEFLVGALPTATLRDVLLYHVAPGRLGSTEVAAASSIETLGGGTVGVALPTFVDREPDLINASLVQTDIAADNGVVHVIDRVMLPFDLPGNDARTIAEIVAANANGFDSNRGDFDILLAAVVAADQAGALADPSANLTVFAPNDGAFTDLAVRLGYTGTTEAGVLGYLIDALTLFGQGNPVPPLTDILTYHIVPEALQASQLLARGTVTTLAGETITVSARPLGVTLTDGDPGAPDPLVVTPDIPASNGIIHAISGVLLAEDPLPSNGADDVRFVIGTDMGETIITGADDDFVNAKGGDDRVLGLDGDDLLLGGDGADTLNGGAGDDVLRGGASDADLRDVIYAGAGDDTAHGGAGNDLIFGMGGDDLIFGDHGTDRLVGGAGMDTVSGGALSDEIFGNDGDDFLNGGFGSDRLNGGAGADRFYHLGIADHGSDWVQDYRFAEGDLLVFGGASATAADFVLHGAVTSGSGDPAINEAFISYRPTGEILWALVDGTAEAGIAIRIAATGETFDLLA
jgi:uncharacterized surface protein with fasciclin (FAS1) repeats